jgi:Ca2+-binding RTX toxin-like protein
VITWNSQGQDDTNDNLGSGVYAQAYNADGTPQGGETLVNTHTASLQQSQQITALSDGGWVITWQSQGQDNIDGGYGVYAQAYNADGTLQGGETLVNTHTTGTQRSPQITALSDGGWVITWESQGQDGSGYGVYAQAYNADGTLQGGETLVNTHTANNQQSPQITALSDGGWVITWESLDQDGSGSGVYAQAYNADGTPQGTVGGEDTIDGTAAANTITFTSLSTTVNAGEGANTITGTSGDNLIIAGAGANTITLTEGNNTINAGDGANTITATEGDNTITLGNGANTITVTEGDNEITSGSGADTITFTSGNNTINAGDGANTIVGTSGINTINTGNGADTITTGGLAGGGNTINAGDGANTIITGLGDDTITAGDGADTITTGGGDDNISAGGGADTITGGAGADVYIFEDGFGNDSIIDFDDFDNINLSAVTNIVDYTDLYDNHLTDVAGNAVISDGADTITLIGVSTNDLFANDFEFFV